MEIIALKQKTTGKSIFNWVRSNTNLILLIIILFIGSVFSENFTTWSNMINLLNRISVNGVMAAGFTMVLLIGGFDLSIGATLSLAAVLVVGLENSTGSPLLAMAVAISAGALMGLLNGFLMSLTRGGTGEAFLITLGTSMVALSAALTYCNGYDLYGVNAGWYKALGQSSLGGLPISAIIWISIMIILQIVIKKTVFGRQMLLCGANRKSAYLSGVNIRQKKIVAFIIAGILAAIAAIIMTSRTTAASPRSGIGGDFDAAISSIIGGNSLIGGKGGMVQVFIGVVIYGLITNILNLLGIDSTMQYIAKGAVLLLAIFADNFKVR